MSILWKIQSSQILLHISERQRINVDDIIPFGDPIHVRGIRMAATIAIH